MNWYLKVLKQYVSFSGRAQRAEYWYFVLFNTLISFALVFVDVALGTFSLKIGTGILLGIYTLAVFLPSLGVSFRRLHDTGRSAWWFLIVLIPIIGPIVLLVFFIQDSKPEENKYGKNPKLAVETIES